MTKLRIDLEWRTTLAVLLLAPVLIALALWQLDRADEKAAIGAQWEQRRVLPPVNLQKVSTYEASNLAYLPVLMRGHFLTGKYFLLDNRILKGKFGYEVLGVFQVEGQNRSVVINRGWIAGDSSRQSLPDTPQIEGVLTITGHVYVPPGEPYLLADLPLEPNWPKRIQAIQMDKIEPAVKAVTDGGLFPYTVRIDSDHFAALTVDWQVVNVLPEKHTGYAVQWFAMAAALIILFILRSSNLWQVLTGTTRKQQ